MKQKTLDKITNTEISACAAVIITTIITILICNAFYWQARIEEFKGVSLIYNIIQDPETKLAYQPRADEMNGWLAWAKRKRDGKLRLFVSDEIETLKRIE